MHVCAQVRASLVGMRRWWDVMCACVHTCCVCMCARVCTCCVCARVHARVCIHNTRDDGCADEYTCVYHSCLQSMSYSAVHSSYLISHVPSTLLISYLRMWLHMRCAECDALCVRACVRACVRCMMCNPLSNALRMRMWCAEDEER